MNTPDSGKINVEFDTEFMDRLARNDKEALLSYTDEATYEEAGQGGYEIRTLIATAATAKGGEGNVQFYELIPIFATSCISVSFEIL